MTERAEAPAGREPTGRPGSYQRSVAGLVAALTILVLAVAGFVAFRGAFRDNEPTQVRAVDVAAVVPAATSTLGFSPHRPQPLPSGWVATSVDWSASAWHIGLLTGDQRYVGVEEGSNPAAEMAAEFVAEDARVVETVRLAGPEGPAPWTLWEGGDGDVGVTREVEGRTVLVVTSGSRAELETLVATLSNG